MSMSEEEIKLSQEMGLEGRYPPFVELLGVTFEPLDSDNIRIKLAMRDDLIVNPADPALHGGVISALMDITGGIAVSVSVLKQIKGMPLQDQARRLNRVSTIDLRVDYLRPGKGKVFTAIGSILRAGKKVAVARMELRNEEQLLIAVGTGTFTAG